ETAAGLLHLLGARRPTTPTESSSRLRTRCRALSTIRFAAEPDTDGRAQSSDRRDCEIPTHLRNHLKPPPAPRRVLVRPSGSQTTRADRENPPRPNGLTSRAFSQLSGVRERATSVKARHRSRSPM